MDLSKPAQVKNLMRRGLRLLVDPNLSAEDKRRIYAFFDGRCAYCGDQIDGNGQLDHLIPTSKRGSNHISNRVLSCGDCNAKRNSIPSGDSSSPSNERAKRISSQMRQQKIEQWISECGDALVIPDAILSVVHEESDRVVEEYDIAVRRIREARRNNARLTVTEIAVAITQAHDYRRRVEQLVSGEYTDDARTMFSSPTPMWS